LKTNSTAAFISEFFKDYNQDDLIVNEFSFDNENILFNNSFVNSFKLISKNELGKCCFVYINNDKELNARTAIKNNVPIIGVFSGTILKILKQAHLLMFSNIFSFFDVDEEEFDIVPDIIIEKVILNKKEYSFETTDNDKMKIFTYLLSNISLRFAIFHEIGHHINGDLTELKEKHSLNFNDAINLNGNIGGEWIFKELHADYFSIHKLVDSIESLMFDTTELLKEVLGYECKISLMAMFQMIVLALVIIHKNLNGRYVPKNSDSDLSKLPNEIRLEGNVINLLFEMERKFPQFHNELIDECNNNWLIESINQRHKYKIHKNILSIEMRSLIIESTVIMFDALYRMVIDELDYDTDLVSVTANSNKIHNFFLKNNIIERYPKLIHYERRNYTR